MPPGYVPFDLALGGRGVGGWPFERRVACCCYCGVIHPCVVEGFLVMS